VSDIDLRLSELRLEPIVARTRTAVAGRDCGGARATPRTGRFSSSAPAPTRMARCRRGAHGQIRKRFAELLASTWSERARIIVTIPSQTDVRCAVAEFSRQRGLMQLDQLVSILAWSCHGEGVVDLRNERVDLSITDIRKTTTLARSRADYDCGTPAIPPSG